jgi:hypothetical protein
MATAHRTRAQHDDRRVKDLIAIKASRASVTQSAPRSMGSLLMEMHWFVWFVIGAMTTFAVVLGGVTALTAGK